MTEQAQLILASALLSFAAFYLIWMKVRVVVLREQLFKIRDRLWDDAYRLDQLDDPAYLTARERLHVLIQYAHHVDLPTFVYAGIKQSDGPPLAIASSNNEAMQSAIEDATLSTAKRLLTYLFLMRLSGLLPLVALLPILIVETTRKALVERFRRALSQSMPAGLTSVLSH